MSSRWCSVDCAGDVRWFVEWAELDSGELVGGQELGLGVRRFGFSSMACGVLTFECRGLDSYPLMDG